MILYLAGIPGEAKKTEYKLDKKNRLFSYFDIQEFSKGGRSNGFHAHWLQKIERLKKLKNDTLLSAATAPGNEQKHEHNMLMIHHRLLSYFLIEAKKLECDKLFKAIKKYNNDKDKRSTN